MKRLLKISLVVLALSTIMISCSRNSDAYDNYLENSTVVYHENSPWIIISFSNGQYAVMKSLNNDVNYWPEKNDILRGDFENTGSRRFYNVSMKYYFNGWLASFANSYDEAYDDLDYYATKDGYPATSALQRDKSIQATVRTGSIKLK